MIRNLSVILEEYAPFLRPHLERIKSSPLGSRIAKGAFWSLTGSVASRGLVLASSIIVARMLGKRGYGELGIIQSTVLMFQAFGTLALGVTAAKYAAEYRLTDPARAGRIVSLSSLAATVLGALFALVLFAMASWLSERTLAAPHLAAVLKIGSLMLFFSALNGSQTGALSGLEAFKIIARVNFYAGVCSFLLLIAGANIGGLEGAVCGLAAGLGLNCILNHLALKSEFQQSGIALNLGSCLQEWKILLTFSLPVVLNGIIVMPVFWVCNTFIVNQPSGYEQMGIFNAANQWRSAILFLPGAIGTIFLPILSNLHGVGETKKFVSIVWYNALFCGSLALLASIPIFIFSRSIMSFYGEGFSGGHDVLALILVWGVLTSITNVLVQAFVSCGRIWICFTSSVIWGIAMIASAWLLRSQGAYGLALAFVIAHVFYVVLYSAGAWTILIKRSISTTMECA